LLAQTKVGGLVLITVTVWLQVVLLLHPSVIHQVFVMFRGQTPLVASPIGLTSTFVQVPVPVLSKLVQQLVAKGESNVQMLPQFTVLLGGQTMLKQFVAQLAPGRTVTVKLQLLLLPQLSVATHFTVFVVPGTK
jgi:hypothetical protein